MLLDFSQNNINVVFEVTEDNRLCLLNFSGAEAQVSVKENERRFYTPVELHIAGENQDDHHGAKFTGTSGSKSLRYVSHTYDKNEIGNKLEFVLENRQVRVKLHYQFYDGLSAVRVWNEVTNISSEIVGLEYVSTFSFTGLDMGDKTIANEKLRIYIPHNSWERETDWKVYTMSDLGFDKNTSFSVKRIDVANTGTWSAKEHLPMGAVKNLETDSTLMWQIEHNGSWHWEISDIVDRIYLKISGPNERENHWYKEIVPGETFETVKAAMCVGKDFDDTVAEMTKYRRRIVRHYESDKNMPVIFNDYMNCLWADPTEEKMIPVIDIAAELGAEYYCMDAGWYADGTWWETVGEWLPVDWRFPNGIKNVFDYIRSKGMIPGIWLEIEVMGIGCPLADKFEDDCFFMRHGKRVIDHGRYHLDFRNEKVRAFATSVVDRVVNEYGVGYIKMDYNIDGGIGTEVDSDSFGDGLLGHNRAHLEWLESIIDKYPDLIIENCASGGMRMEYANLALLPVQSTSDQTDYRWTGNVAAAVATACLPEQALIWSYPMVGDDDNAVIFNMVNAMLLRLQLSGQVMDLPENQMALIKEGVECYKNLRKYKKASVPFWPLGVESYDREWLCAGYKTEDIKLVSVWRMHAEDNTVMIPTTGKSGKAEILYPTSKDYKAEALDDGVKVTLPEKYTAVVLKLS